MNFERSSWRIIANAWEPYLGSRAAESYARDVVTIFLLSDPSYEEVEKTLTRVMLGAVAVSVRSFSGSTVIDAVVAAMEALGLK